MINISRVCLPQSLVAKLNLDGMWRFKSPNTLPTLASSLRHRVMPMSRQPVYENGCPNKPILRRATAGEAPCQDTLDARGRWRDWQQDGHAPRPWKELSAFRFAAGR